MKKQLEEMQRYFENKILAGEFELITIDEYTARIKIEGSLFEIWIANGFKHVATHEGGYNAIAIKFKDKKGVYDSIKHSEIDHEIKEQCDVCDWMELEDGSAVCKKCGTFSPF